MNRLPERKQSAHRGYSYWDAAHANPEPENPVNPVQENFLRTIERMAFFFLAPGFTDHWPSDYEFKVRMDCLLRLEARPGGPKFWLAVWQPAHEQTLCSSCL